MISEYFVAVGITIATWFSTLIPDFPVPAWFAGLGGTINSLFTYAVGLQPFVDWAFVAVVAVVPISLWSFGLLFRVARIVVSHIPFFGGR